MKALNALAAIVAAVVLVFSVPLLAAVQLVPVASGLTQPPCSYSITPTSQAAVAAGATGSVNVTTGQGCMWTTAANVSWLHVSAAGNGSGSGSAAYFVDANTAATARTGTATIAGQTFTVNQAAAAAASCTFTISPTRATFASGGGSGSVTVTTGPGCTWTATSAETWITVTGGAYGYGSGTVTYAVSAYAGRQGNRNGRMTIAGEAFTVKQSH